MSEKKLYLTVGKEVSLSFTGKFEQLKYVKLSVNKLAELLKNELVNNESIFDIEEICLITKSNYTTVVKVVGNKQEIKGSCESVNVRVDKSKTRERKEGKKLFTSGDFVFVVDQNQNISRNDLYSLNIKNAERYKKERK